MNKKNAIYLISITLVATLGGLLFGYDTAVISGAEKSINNYLVQGQGLNAWIHGVTVSSALIGCVIGGLISGWIANRIGRKKALILAAILFVITALGSGYPEFLFFQKGHATLGVLAIFNIYRIIGGVGVGIASAICPIYISEIAPANIRGSLVSLNQFAIVLGILVVYFVNWGIVKGRTQEWINDTGWRWMFMSGAIPAGLFGLLLFLVPETPRYLVMVGNRDKALHVLQKINSGIRAQEILTEIESTVENSSGRLWSYGKKIIFIGILISIFQQFVGINVAMYYAPRIFESMGAARDSSMLQSVVMGVVNLIFTIIAIVTVDRWGRKPLLIIGSAGMAIGMFSISVLSFNNILGMGTLISIVLFTASFMMSWGPICWVLISEIFPNKIRGKAVAIAVAFQWAANFVVSSTFPAMIQISSWGTYSIYGLMSLLSLVFVWKMVPETKKRSLEEMEKLWLTE
jgi:SP family xylose:H+ symportor-like MFS transporter